MKRLILYLVCFSFNIGISQIINIPDANFKALLVNSSTSLNTASDCLINSYYKIDENNDGEIEVAEALQVCQLILINANISDLTGIKAFTNLRGLWCANNNLTYVNLSPLIHLEGIIFFGDQLTSLDVSNLTNLSYLSCQNNQITSLNISNTPMLEKVFCKNNQLTSLDFSSNPLFNELDCMNNPNLTSVNIQNGAMQLLGIQTFYNECWSGLPNLTTICADNNEVVALQNYLTSCGTDISGINFHGNCALGNEEFGNDSIQIYPNPASSTVNINVNINIKTIELIDVQGRILVSKTVNESQFILDVSDYAKGIYYVKVNTDKGSKIEKLVKK
jgi:hypothetical protein